MPVIPATQEAEIKRITVRSQPGEIVGKTVSQKYPIQIFFISFINLLIFIILVITLEITTFQISGIPWRYCLVSFRPTQ
jgi:hypothetical protein